MPHFGPKLSGRHLPLIIERTNVEDGVFIRLLFQARQELTKLKGEVEPLEIEQYILDNRIRVERYMAHGVIVPVIEPVFAESLGLNAWRKMDDLKKLTALTFRIQILEKLISDRDEIIGLADFIEFFSPGKNAHRILIRTWRAVANELDLKPSSEL